LAGLVSQVSLASLQRAAASSYVNVLGMIARDFIGAVPVDGLPGDRDAASDLPMPDELPEIAGDQARSSSTDEDKVALIRRQHPDVVWVAGGTDGGSREPVRDLVETVALGCTLVDGPP
ncbi:MAG: hypothetical protein GTO41_10735, partial [Burkholderiales bacterium]|nr:hypothetical protein [Burkholderiales bacterium]